MKALLYQGPGRTSLEEIHVPTLGDGEALIAVEACGLCGSDIAKMDSDLPRPVPLGHEVAGRILELGPKAKRFKKGERVVLAHHVPCLKCHYCRHGNESMCREFKQSNLDPGGFSQLVRASARHVEHTLLSIPAGLSFAQAAMTEPLACCLRNLRRLNLRPKDIAVLIGLGSIGLMTAQLLRREGVSVIGLDPEPSRVCLAQKLGLDHAYTGKDGRIQQVLSTLSQTRGADALIFTAGNVALVAERLDWVRDGGIVNIFANLHPQPMAPVDLNEIYSRELTVMSSYSPELRDLKQALRLISQGVLDVSPYTCHTFPLSRFDEALRQVRGREILKAILLPQKTT